MPPKVTIGTGRAGALAMLALAAIGTGCRGPARENQLAYFPNDPARARVVHLVSFNSLQDLIPRSPTLKEMLDGYVVSPFVETPSGLAFRDGSLHACETRGGSVQSWNLVAGRGGTHRGSEHLETPVAVAADGRGLYVADTGRARIVALAPDGAQRFAAQPPGRADYRPTAVAVRDGRVYATDVSAHCVDVFAASDGAHLATWGGPGRSNGKFWYPTGIAADEAGIVVTEMVGARVQTFTPDGAFQQSFGQPGNAYGDLGNPKHVALAPDGTVLIVDAGFGCVHLFDRSGRLLIVIGADHERSGGLPLPVGIAVAREMPEPVVNRLPPGFVADYYFIVSSSTGDRRLSLYAVGRAGAAGRSPAGDGPQTSRAAD